MRSVVIDTMSGLAQLLFALLTAIVLVGASGAGAVTFDVIGISGANPAGMLPGETITVDVRVVADTDQVYGLGASVYGYDEAVIDYVDASGQAVGGIFYAVCLPPPNGCLQGVENLITSPLVESAIGSQGNRVWLFTGTNLFSSSAHPDDPGLDGIIAGGDAQFRFAFEAVAPGSAQIVIGTGYEGDGVVLDAGQVSQAVGGE